MTGRWRRASGEKLGDRSHDDYLVPPSVGIKISLTRLSSPPAGRPSSAKSRGQANLSFDSWLAEPNESVTAYTVTRRETRHGQTLRAQGIQHKHTSTRPRVQEDRFVPAICILSYMRLWEAVLQQPFP